MAFSPQNPNGITTSSNSSPVVIATEQEAILNNIAKDVSIGSLTEIAPATDTASSGLNGRLQRIAQRITSLIGLFPTSLGQKTSANSLGIAIANEQIQDGFITGQAGQSVLGNNILLAVAGTTSIDTLTTNEVSYRSFYCQIIGSAGIASGQIVFEGSNDNTNFVTLLNYDDAAFTGTTIIAPISIAANTNRFFAGKIPYRYLRCRISTAFVGGTVSAIVRLSQVDYIPKITSVNQATGQNFSTTISSSLPSGTTTIGAVNLSGATTQGASTYAVVISNGTNSLTQIKSGATTANTIEVSNNNASERYVKIFNALSGSVVMGTTAAQLSFMIPANSSKTIDCGTFGIRFTTAYTIAITANIALNDNTSVGANQVTVSTTYF
jgi:hypothetical protein